MKRDDDYKHGFTDAATAHAVPRRIGCSVYRVGGAWRLTTVKPGTFKQRYSRAEQKRITQRIVDRIEGL